MRSESSESFDIDLYGLGNGALLLVYVDGGAELPK